MELIGEKFNVLFLLKKRVLLPTHTTTPVETYVLMPVTVAFISTIRVLPVSGALQSVQLVPHLRSAKAAQILITYQVSGAYPALWVVQLVLLELLVKVVFLGIICQTLLRV